MKKIVAGITGASGSIYALRFLMQATKLYDKIYLSVSDQANQVAESEMGFLFDPSNAELQRLMGNSISKLIFMDRKDYFSPPASGSFRHEGMVIVPCSMGTAGRIANGISDDLITRAADVCLKEKRKLILVVRETPFNLVHLRNLTMLAEAGATVLPACPSFYFKPTSINDIADTVISRVLQNLGANQKGMPQWQYPETE
jgi:4-hydroxy-3-polyprenylbenzoate decarboxylase